MLVYLLRTIPVVLVVLELSFLQYHSRLLSAIHV